MLRLSGLHGVSQLQSRVFPRSGVSARLAPSASPVSRTSLEAGADPNFVRDPPDLFLGAGDTMMNRVRLVLVTAVFAACGAGESAEDQPSTPAVEIAAPTDGATVVGGPLELTLTVTHLELRPAGTDEPNTGHHHMFINRDIVAEGEVIPAEEGVVHLGAAQTFYVFENLEPGTYTVIAVLGDHQHARISGAKTDTVRFTVDAP